MFHGDLGMSLKKAERMNLIYKNYIPEVHRNIGFTFGTF